MKVVSSRACTMHLPIKGKCICQLKENDDQYYNTCTLTFLGKNVWISVKDKPFAEMHTMYITSLDKADS